MAAISKEQYIPIADRVAKQSILLENSVLESTSGLGYYRRVHGPLPDTGDFELENDLILAANNTDNKFVFSNAATTFLNEILTSLNTHVGIRGGANVNSVDDYLTRSGINVHELYAVSHSAVLGADLSAVNVFRDDEIEFANLEITSSGVGTFSDCDKLGTGSGSFVRDTNDPNTTPNSAAQQAEVFVASGIGSGNNLIVNVIGTSETGVALDNQVTIPLSTAQGTKFSLGSDEYLDVTTIQFAGGNASDVVTVRSKVERNVGL